MVELYEWELMPVEGEQIIVIGKTTNGVNVFTSFIESFVSTDTMLQISTLRTSYTLRRENAKSLLPLGGDFDAVLEPLRKARLSNIEEIHKLAHTILKK